MKSFAFLWCLIAFLMIADGIYAQKHLVLSHNRKGEHRIFRSGDLIRLQTTDKQRYVGNIELVNDSVLIISQLISYKAIDKVVNNKFREIIPIKNIALVFKESDKLWDATRYGLYAGTVLAGSAIIGVSVANSLILGAAPPVGILIVISGVLFSGLMFKYLGRDQYKIGRKWKILVK